MMNRAETFHKKYIKEYLDIFWDAFILRIESPQVSTYQSWVINWIHADTS